MTSKIKAPAQPVKFLSRQDLRERGITFGKSHLQRMMNEGKFPKATKLGTRKIAWEENAVNAWCLQKMAESNSAAA